VSKALEITPLELERIRTGVDDAWLSWLRASVTPRGVYYGTRKYPEPGPTGFRSWRFGKLPALAGDLLCHIYAPSEHSKLTDVYQARLLFRLIIGRVELHGPEVAAEFQRSNREDKDSNFLRWLANAKDFLQSHGVYEHPEMTRLQKFLLRYWDTPHPEAGYELFRFTAKDIAAVCHDILGRRQDVDGSATKMVIHRLNLPSCCRCKIPYSHKVTFDSAWNCAKLRQAAAF
jgi:hypothetical protein